MRSEVDLVVVGGGLAGCTAGLFAARGGCSALVLTGETLGGELLNASLIEDFPGFPQGVSGYELCPAVQEQAQSAGAAFEMAGAQSLDRHGATWQLVTTAGTVAARAVALCTGTSFRALGVPGERELAGRGVSHCATCDGPLLKGARAVVVGGGDSGVKEALELAGHADEVVVVEIEEALTAQPAYRDRLDAQANVAVRCSSEVDEIAGEGHVETVVVRDGRTGARDRLEAGGVFVYVGLAPTTPRLPEVDRDRGGHLQTDLHMRTSLPGLFAAGSVRSDFPGQAVVAAGDGATAALAAVRYLADGIWPASA